MDRETFRLILLVLGVVLVATVYYWDRLRGLFRGRPARRSGVPRQEPQYDDGTPAELEDDLVELEGLIRTEEPPDVLLEGVIGEARPVRRAPPPPPAEVPPGEPAVDVEAEDDAPPAPESEPEPAPRPSASPAPAPAPKVLALTLVATGGSISGIRLRRVLTDHGLGLSSRGLFERVGEAGTPLFSAANLLEPGTFDLATLEGLSTPGVVLFQVLDGDGDHAATFDSMLATAEKLAARLDCELCDTRRRRLGRDALAALRAEAEQAGR